MGQELIEAMRRKDFTQVVALSRASPALINLPSGEEAASPFHNACTFGQREFALFFLENGGDIHSLSGEKKTPLQCVIVPGGHITNLTQAQVDDRTAIAQALINAGSKLTPDLILGACSMGAGKARKLVTLLLARGAPLTGTEDYSGGTLLHDAVEYGHTEVVVAALANKKIPIDRGIKTYPVGNTALHIAAKKKLRPMIEMLLAAGARSDLVNARGETARTLAPKALLPLFDGKAAAPAKAAPVSATPSKDLLARLWKTPTDPTVLSVLADWLLEQGETTRAEFVQLSILPKPTSAQAAKKAQLLKKHRGAWLGKARTVVSSWEDSTQTPGFVARATVPPEKFAANFELIRALGPELIVTLMKVKSRLLTQQLAKLPLGTLFGLDLRSPVRAGGYSAAWLDDTAIDLLAPALKGLRWLSLTPEFQLDNGRFTAKTLETLAPVVGSTLETLTLVGRASGPIASSHVGALTPKNFPALKRLSVPAAEAGLRRELNARWKGRSAKLDYLSPG